MTSYSSILSRIASTAGRDVGSFISMELREFSLRQSRSSLVYRTAGAISNRSAPTASARFSATLAVMPLAEKYATSFLLMSYTPLKMQIVSTSLIIPLFDFSCYLCTSKMRPTQGFCTSQQKLDTRTRKIGHENRVSKDAILDRTLKNDVVAIPTAKNSSAIGEYLAVGDCIVSFFKNPSRTSHLRRWLRRR